MAIRAFQPANKRVPDKDKKGKRATRPQPRRWHCTALKTLARHRIRRAAPAHEPAWLYTKRGAGRREGAPAGACKGGVLRRRTWMLYERAHL